MVNHKEGSPLISKNKRIVNKDLCNSYQDMSCAICFIRGGGRICGHHIKPKGSGGHDHTKNLIPVCHKHHMEFHNKGLRYVINTYDTAKEYLEFLGFVITDEDISYPDIQV